MSTEYVLKHSTRTRAMRVEVLPDAQVIVTVPRFFSYASVERFLARHTQWIDQALAQTRGKKVIRFSRKDISALKKRAAAAAAARCKHFAQVYGVQFKKISIRAQKSRWGSCSRSGALSFNYKIAALPERVADYIIIHEICHLREMNHSRKFWDLVTLTVPEHREIRKSLRNTVVVFR